MPTAGSGRAATMVTENPIWPRPVIIPVTDQAAGVKQPVIVPRGWKTISNPEGEFWSVDNNISHTRQKWATEQLRHVDDVRLV
jgi:hypothetical protein